MSVQLLSRVTAAQSKNSETGTNHYSPGVSWPARSALAVGALAAVSIMEPPTASAVPSYTRQTGQPCATCHTAFPELTPYGRQFKLRGYTAGGTRCDDGRAKSDETQVPLAVMAWPANMTHVKNNANLAATGGSISNDAWMPGQFSLFIAGQLYCDVGAFSQMTYDRIGNGFSWDNTDIRYAKTGVIDGTSIVYGITANNVPTVQDVWNSTPAWAFPYITSSVAPGPAAATMLGSKAWGAQVAGVGGYVWINNSIYAELTAYGNLSQRLLTDLAGSAVQTNRFPGAAPYWRLAYERTWDKNSLMFGTFGMYAEVQPTGAGTAADGTLSIPDTTPFVRGVTDPTLDIGLDTQYQWIGEENAVTVRASWIWEKKKNNAELSDQWAAAAGGAGAFNPSDQLNDLSISASYIYDRSYSFTAGYFSTFGTKDPVLYASPNGSPNSSGWNLDAAWLPFSKGGPEIWPGFNARIGVQYTHYDKFDGTWYNPDTGLKAGGNDTILLYTWLMF